MSSQPKILAFAGSLRKDSYNKKLVKVAAKGSEESGAIVTYIDLKEYPLPIYDEDIETIEIPENVHKLKKIFKEHDGWLISSPEYNSSYSAALKNTIDWISRKTEDKENSLSCFENKVALLMSASPGGLGGGRGLVHLKQLLGSIKVIVLPNQCAVSRAFEVFNEDGNIKDEVLSGQVKDLGRALSSFLTRLGDPS